MRRKRTLAAGLATLLLGLGALACRPAQAEPDPGTAAYYVVVLPADTGNSSNVQIIQINDGSGSHVQVGDGSASVDCTRFATADDANAAASLAHPGANWTVVLAPDALHALLTASGVSPDLANLLPAVADADICVPAAS